MIFAYKKNKDDCSFGLALVYQKEESLAQKLQLSGVSIYETKSPFMGVP